MKKYSNEVPAMTIGLDVGEKTSYYVILERQGQVVEEGRIRTTEKELEKHFGGRGGARVAIEVGSQSGWLSRLLASWGHEVIVANPRKLRGIYQNRHKTDRVDAQYLARVARLDPELLAPVRHRGAQAQRDLQLLRARDNLVKARTQLINLVRGTLKQFGVSAGRCSAERFAVKVSEVLTPEWKEILGEVVETIEGLTQKIRSYDKKIEAWGAEKYRETQRLRQVNGVGAQTALAFVLTLEQPERFVESRSVGAYLGLCPRRDQSGEKDPELGISKQGDPYLRRLLIQCAHYILGPFGEDCELRRYGERIAAGGGKNAKKRAVVAVARKLAVLLLALWKSGAVYDPFYHRHRQAA